MALGSIMAGILLVAATVSWYGLQVVALRDLVHRSRVRGDNKLLWAFAILCVPYAGALSYLIIGPMGFTLRYATARHAGAGRTPDRLARRTTRQAVRRATTRRTPVSSATHSPARSGRPASPVTGPLSPEHQRTGAFASPAPVPDHLRRDVLLSQRPMRKSGLRPCDGDVRWPRGVLPPLDDIDHSPHR